MHSNIFSNLHSLYNIKKNLSLSAVQIEDMQLKKLQALIMHAYANVPYYHNLFNKTGIRPGDIKTRSDLLRIPITTKSHLQNLTFNEKITKGIDKNKCLNLRTSGSTGRPLDIFITKEEVLRSKTIAFLNMYLENGCQLTDRTLRVVTPSFITKERLWFQRLGILREYFISIFDDINVQLNTFLQTRPHAIRGFTSGIKSLALKVKEMEIKFKPPKVIFTTAEVLSPMDRRLISSTFQAEVVDYYCCNEVGIIAYECKEHDGYHINDDNVIIEFIREDGTLCKSGEEGNIVITGLNRYIMPFIRYQIGDRGIIRDKPCRCGKAFHIIETIIGRDNDQIMLPDGNKVSSHLLLNVIIDIPGILAYQIIQKERDRISIQIVKDKHFSEDLIVSRIEKGCHQVLNGKIKVESSIVDEIPKEKTGKFKVIKNEVSNLRSYLLQ